MPNSRLLPQAMTRIMTRALFQAMFLVLLAFCVLASAPLKAAEIRLSLPPDPNALPVFVLMEKQDEFLPDDQLKLVANPAGDPSAMRAMIAAQRMDFAMFNLVGGTRFIQGGLEELHLVRPWVWRGIYLLTPAGTDDLAVLDDRIVLVAPGVSTPPHILTQKALAQDGIHPRFVSGGAGAVLFSRLRDPKKAPAAVAAPEPMVSLIEHRQQAQDWEQRWQIALDPTEALGGDIPLGALWQVGNDVDPALRQRLVKGLTRAAEWTQNPANHEEAARIAAEGYQHTFRMPIPPQALEDLLREQRVVWQTDDDEHRARIEQYLSDVFGIAVPAGLYLEAAENEASSTDASPGETSRTDD